MKIKLEQQLLDAMSKDPNNWKGPIYFNRKDPRLIVPKLEPLRGSTFNFGSIYTYITLGAIIIIVIAWNLLSK